MDLTPIIPQVAMKVAVTGKQTAYNLYITRLVKNSMKNSFDLNPAKTPPEQQRLYHHCTTIVDEKSPEELIALIQALWINGTNYPNEQVESDRDTLLSYKVEQEAFNICLYKCCQILIEAWEKTPATAEFIPKLVGLFTGPANPDADAYWRSRTALRLHERLQAFRKSEQCQSLQHFLGLLQPQEITVNQIENQPLQSLLYRYPYLYPYSVSSEDSGSLSATLRRLKSKKTKEFDTNLSQYVISQVRRSLPEANEHQTTKNSLRIFSKNNPTFLTDKELNRALQEYLGKVDGHPSNRDLAQSFSNYQQSNINFYGDFKKLFYQYLTKTLNSSYGIRQFSPLLEKHLETIFPAKADDPISDFLSLRTCTATLQFLVVDMTPPYKHVIFMNLISNLGAIRTMSLLMKIILICPQARPQLEKQLWILFKNYAASPCPQVKGLIKIWENYNVAQAAYFGKADLSWCLQIPRTN